MLRQQKELFAELISDEAGKPLQFARAEVDRGAMTFELASEEAKRIDGEVLPLDLAAHARDRMGIVRRFPVGLVLAISPFNFPLNLVAHKVAPAIAAGCSFILKPPSQAPLTSLALAKVIEESGFPSAAFSVLPCRSSVAERMVKDDRIAVLSFTGSPAVGWPLKAMAGKKRVVLELGGNAGVIIGPEAVRGFLAAVQEATQMINADSSKWNNLLTEQSLVPAPIIETFKLPPFPKASVPTEEQWADALAWAKEKGLVKTDISYNDSVNSSFLP